jgi:hypothetical protein
MNVTASPRTLASLTERGLIPSVERIIATYRAATDEQLSEGLHWYADAHSLAVALDRENPLRAAGVIAALSPLTPWERNKALAVRAFADGVATGHMKAAMDKANRILAGEDVVAVLNAPKTSAFAATIADPTDAHAVVVDRHAMSVAIGRPSTDEDTKALALKGVYDLYADAYREAARRIGTAPSVVQAVTWVVWRQTSIRTAASVVRVAQANGHRAA